MSTRLLPRLLLFAFLTAAAAAQQQLAFPRLTGQVVDEADVLDPSAEADLGRELEAHERATGQQVVVATLRSLQGHTVEEFANGLFRDWRLGRAEQDDGALLVVAPRERKVRIEVGYGLEGVLTDAASATIIQSLVLPRFRSGDMEGGIVAGTRGMLELLRPEDGAAAGREPGWTTGSQPNEELSLGEKYVILLGMFGLTALLLLIDKLVRRRRGYGLLEGGPTPVVWVGSSASSREELDSSWSSSDASSSGHSNGGWLLGQGWTLRRWRRLGQLVT
jgi:uncharacterized protein